jgi:hypothetical protein
MISSQAQKGAMDKTVRLSDTGINEIVLLYWKH